MSEEDYEEFFESETNRIDKLMRDNEGKLYNTYYISGSNSGEIFFKIILAENTEEAIASLKLLDQYHDAKINYIKLRDGNVIFGKEVEK